LFSFSPENLVLCILPHLLSSSPLQKQYRRGRQSSGPSAPLAPGSPAEKGGAAHPGRHLPNKCQLERETLGWSTDHFLDNQPHVLLSSFSILFSSHFCEVSSIPWLIFSLFLFLHIQCIFCLSNSQFPNFKFKYNVDPKWQNTDKTKIKTGNWLKFFFILKGGSF
jgi:hypothetical protein